MLGIKTVLAAYDPVGCLVFDEIDSGISGATADKVGAAIEALAATRQVICITHLPQIAARGGRHLMVRKQTSAGRTESVVEQLSESARRQEIARLLSGVEITQESLAQADKLLGSSQGAAVAHSGQVEV
jgi:DNA repair protein RecN (Recombination protein N)